MRIINKKTTKGNGVPPQATTSLRPMTGLLAQETTTKRPIKVPVMIRKTTDGIEGDTVDPDGMGTTEEGGLLEEDYSVVGMGSQMHIALTDSSLKH